jgi:hypothetical protein
MTEAQADLLLAALETQRLLLVDLLALVDVGQVMLVELRSWSLRVAGFCFGALIMRMCGFDMSPLLIAKKASP